MSINFAIKDIFQDSRFPYIPFLLKYYSDFENNNGECKGFGNW